MALLIKEPQTLQPVTQVGIDWSNSICTALRAAFIGGVPLDVSKVNPRLSGQTISRVLFGSRGFYYPSGGLPAYLNSSSLLNLPVKHTVFALASFTNTNDQVVAHKGQNSVDFANYSLRVGISDGAGTTSKINYVVRSYSASGGFVAVDSIDAPLNRVLALAGWHDGATVRLFRDGQQVASATGNASAPYTNTSRFYIAGEANADAGLTRWFLSGHCPLVLLFARSLTFDEIARLSANPWQVFTPKRITAIPTYYPILSNLQATRGNTSASLRTNIKY